MMEEIASPGDRCLIMKYRPFSTYRPAGSRTRCSKLKKCELAIIIRSRLSEMLWQSCAKQILRLINNSAFKIIKYCRSIIYSPHGTCNHNKSIFEINHLSTALNTLNSLCLTLNKQHRKNYSAREGTAAEINEMGHLKRE